ncbi:MAG: hypothetical protein JXA23_10325 [Bacteroidales bacterium]|nr:hypothetical protein [Bacteroidales bacterium]
MWFRFIAQGKGFLTRLEDYIRKKHYNETVISSILNWIPYIVGSVVNALVAILDAKIFDYINRLTHLVKDNFSWLFFIITPCCLAGWRRDWPRRSHDSGRTYLVRCSPAH